MDGCFCMTIIEKGSDSQMGKETHRADLGALLHFRSAVRAGYILKPTRPTVTRLTSHKPSGAREPQAVGCIGRDRVPGSVR